jgi:hypothetical protein
VVLEPDLVVLLDPDDTIVDDDYEEPPRAAPGVRG